MQSEASVLDRWILYTFFKILFDEALITSVYLEFLHICSLDYKIIGIRLFNDMTNLINYFEIRLIGGKI